MPAIPNRRPSAPANPALQSLPQRLAGLFSMVATPLKHHTVGQVVACGRCGVGFRMKIANQKWCSAQCRDAQYAEGRPPNKYPKAATCEHCKATYTASVSTQRWCSPNCRKAYHVARKPLPIAGKVIHRDRYPRGRYVYGWYKDDDELPFYIGKGVYARAWERHVNSSKISAACQDIRRECKNFRVVVYKDNLTAAGALLVETLLIDVFRSLGACLTNNRVPIKRRIKSVLELQQCR